MQPTGPAPIPAMPAQPVASGAPRPGVTIRGRRFTLPWVIGGVVAILVVLICGCCGTVTLASALNGNTTARATATTGHTGAPAQAQATHAPQATATPLAGKDVTHLVGAGNGGRTGSFTVQGTWAITWGCSPTYSDTLMVMVDYQGPNDAAPDGLDPPTIRATCAKGGTQGTQVYHDAGGQYLISVISGASWYINVIDVAG